MMSQLKMYCLPKNFRGVSPLPEGYSYSLFNPATDVHAWCECLRGGHLIDGRSDDQAFFDEIINFKDLVPSTDIHFLDYLGEHIGTATGFVHSPANIGDMHQVGLKEEFRGRGLSKYLGSIVLSDLFSRGVRFVSLTSGEGRPAALKSYLSAGFLPVEYAEGMVDRWENVLETFGTDSILMLNDDGTPYKTIYRKGLGK